MPALPLTISVSLCLALTFIVFFVRAHARGQFRSSEQEALLPLADETSHPQPRR